GHRRHRRRGRPCRRGARSPARSVRPRSRPCGHRSVGASTPAGSVWLAAVAVARAGLARSGERARVEHGGFEDMARIAALDGNTDVSGVLMDLGVSSHQLDRAERGFSYRFAAPLDMRMDAKQSLTAPVVVNEYDEQALTEIISRFGEERFARRVAQEIVRSRPLAS